MPESLAQNSAPCVSVVIPVYTGMSTLPLCLDSLERQDYSGGFEVIIVDDGSADGSGDYAEKRGIKVIRQKNQGPGIARNTGVAIAQGEYVVFTDDDCILDTDFITEIVKPLIGTEIIGSQGQIYSRQKSIVAQFIHYEYFERYDLLEKADYIDWVATYAACYTREAFLEVGGFNNTYSSEDCELSFRMSEQGYKMVFAPKARSQHKHFDNYFKFIRYKYKRAYWSIWLYKTFPNRIVDDRLTPITRKLMMLSLGLSGWGFLLSLFWNTGLYVGAFFFLTWLIMTLPQAYKIFRRNKLIGMISPFFYLTRTVSYVFGVAKGLYDYWRGIITVKESSAK